MRKAAEKGLYSEAQLSILSRQQILEIIFFDDFYTKSTVDLYSGRGVGLAAVYAELANLGGSVSVETEAGQYTRFKFVLPLYQKDC